MDNTSQNPFGNRHSRRALEANSKTAIKQQARALLQRIDADATKIWEHVERYVADPTVGGTLDAGSDVFATHYRLSVLSDLVERLRGKQAWNDENRGTLAHLIETLRAQMGQMAHSDMHFDKGPEIAPEEKARQRNAAKKERQLESKNANAAANRRKAAKQRRARRTAFAEGSPEGYISIGTE